MLPKKFSVSLLRPLLRAEGADPMSVFFHKSETIFSHGDPSDSMFYIDKGSVKLTVTSPEGREAFLAFFDGGHFFGESCIASEFATRFHTATALTDLQVLKLDGSAMKRILRTNAELGYTFIVYLLSRNAQIQGDMASNLLYSSEARLRRVLWSLAELSQTDGGGAPPKLRQQDLASIIGVSRQRVNVLMKRLRK